jgi:LysM repeat protein
MNIKKSALRLSLLVGERRVTPIFLLFLGAWLLIGCGSEPQVVEVTRLVNEEVPVTVEVAQVTTVEVPVEVTVEVPLEVTRLVEVVVSATPLPTEAATAAPTGTTTPTATAVAAGSTYTIQAGDTLAAIAARTGVPMADIIEANDLSNQNLLQAGQELLIPGWDGTPLAVPTVISTPTTAAAAATAAATAGPTTVAASGENLLPNASFEDDWYFFNSINELQIPVGWSTSVDEGPNTLTDDPDDLFLRPEIRVVPSSDLPASEVPQFIFEGNKTIKAFKGGAPTSFAIFTDIALPAGSYRFTISFFPDIVSIYQEGQKVWATDPLAAELRFILNEGGTDWTTTQIGAKNTMTYDFSLSAPATVRLGAAFRNRYVNNNNGWFLDNWSLHRLEEP